ncbi:MAG: peptidoglycan bridge formation glycyltransferase FemA/FemB family protein [Chloroflexi bacterium]|nr:peptidoglycan bridge formation glycyltransferase FemA/FemB family protein [Chloroflexota bacterium]
MSLTHHQIPDPTARNALHLSLPAPHLLQSWSWGELKETFGWQATRLSWAQSAGPAVAAAQLLIRRVAGGLALAYSPKGPILDWRNENLRSAVFADLVNAPRKEGALVLKIDPKVPYGDGLGQDVERGLRATGWRKSQDKVQFRNTLVLDLLQDEEALLQGMKQKWRYNVRLPRGKAFTCGAARATKSQQAATLVRARRQERGLVINPRVPVEQQSCEDVGR